jgi:hypothetical protein
VHPEVSPTVVWSTPAGQTREVRPSSDGVEIGCASKGRNGELAFRGTFEFVTRTTLALTVVSACPDEPT